MQFGYRIIDDLISGLQTYMASRGISQLADLAGEKIKDFSPASELDRETMVFPKIDRELCVGCGRCSVSCYDGGHQAITFDESRKPKIIGQNSSRKPLFLSSA
ncbi:MAG: 4Fe-4S binding protein [Bacteroidales bacterium]|nr:4Fe-4S binding protein [Bacteroidales bacterium]